MAERNLTACTWALVWAISLAITLAFGSPLPVGSLVGSRNTTLDGHAPLPHTTVLSGDCLQVADGLALVTLERGTRIILGRESEATFLRDAGAVKVSLARGDLALYHPVSDRDFHVEADGVRVTPARDSKTLAELDMAGGVLAITAKDGALRVEVSGITREIRQGQSLTINLEAARAAGAGPAPDRHPRHIFSRKVILKSTLLGMGAAAASAIAITRPSRQSSPVTPLP